MSNRLEFGLREILNAAMQQMESSLGHQAIEAYCASSDEVEAQRKVCPRFLDGSAVIQGGFLAQMENGCFSAASMVFDCQVRKLADKQSAALS